MMEPPKVISAGGAGSLVGGPKAAGEGNMPSVKMNKSSPPRNISKNIGKESSNNSENIGPRSEISESEPQHVLHDSHELFEMVPLGEELPSKVPNEEHRPLNKSVDDLTDDYLIEGTSNSDSSANIKDTRTHEYKWLFFCFLGIMFSFVMYGILLEYVTSGGRKLHELSFLFVTSLFYTLTGAAGRHVRDEKPSNIPPFRFAVLGITSMGSTFCSVRSLKYVIFPIQVLAKSCKPVPVMIIGSLLGKRYPPRKFVNVIMIVLGVGLFMGGGDTTAKKDVDSNQQIIGIILLFTSLCFDGGTGAYEDMLMSDQHVGPFDLMYNIQLGKTILAGVGLIVFNEVHVFLQMIQDMGFLLVALSLSGAVGQTFIFITISKFGALTCSIIGLARKVTTLVASIFLYGHVLNSTQSTGLVICVTAMVINFMGKSGKKEGGHGNEEKTKPHIHTETDDNYGGENAPMLENDEEKGGEGERGAHV